jgi:uncharacterized protein YbjT (DUF2867 family)
MILVTGGTGRIGRHLVSELSAHGEPVRAFARTAVPVPIGVDLVLGDLVEPTAVEPALEDVEAAFLLWPQATAIGHGGTVDLIASRVERVVYLSSLSVRTAPNHPMAVIHADIERRLERAGAAWTFLRVGKLDSNALGYATPIRETGEVRLPYPAVGRAPIHEADVAAVAAALLLEDGRTRRALQPSGPKAMTEADIVRMIGEIVGRDIRIVEISPEESRAEMLASGVTPHLADSALAYWRGLVEEPEPVTTTVQEVTGRPARTFASWVRENADPFV